MKATLTFYLPDELDAFQTAQKSIELKSVIDEFDSWLRMKIRAGENVEANEKALRILHELIQHRLT